MRDETMIEEESKGINWKKSVFMVLFHLGAIKLASVAQRAET
jgi:hypothetical protein